MLNRAITKPTIPPVEIVCLCGSTRFKEQFEKVNAQLTMSGRIVLSVGCFVHSEAPIADEQKTKLDELHFRKIDLADAIYVVNVAGYVGLSTMREIAYAICRHKAITFLDEESGHITMEAHSHTLGRMVASFAEGRTPPL